MQLRLVSQYKKNVCVCVFMSDLLDAGNGEWFSERDFTTDWTAFVAIQHASPFAAKACSHFTCYTGILLSCNPYIQMI